MVAKFIFTHIKKIHKLLKKKSYTYRNIHKYILTNSEILNKNKFQHCILTGGEKKTLR